MRISLSLGEKQLNKASAIIESKVDVLLKKMIPAFLRKLADIIIDTARKNLNATDLPSTIVDEVNGSWRVEPKLTTSGTYMLKIYNAHEKAVYLEFGTGIIGFISPHPLASSTPYQYNVGSEWKDGDMAWRFRLREGEALDVKQSAILHSIKKNNHSNDMIIKTQGQTGVMYLYDVMFDIINDRSIIVNLWERIKEVYFLNANGVK
jgi:hypothetical protein